MRMQDAKYPVRMLDAAQSGPFQIAIAHDPSGNAIEFAGTTRKWAVGGAKLIVSDRQKAEEFYTKIFNAIPRPALQDTRLR